MRWQEDEGIQPTFPSGSVTLIHVPSASLSRTLSPSWTTNASTLDWSGEDLAVTVFA